MWSRSGKPSTGYLEGSKLLGLVCFNIIWAVSANGNTSGLQPEIESSILSRSTKFNAGCNRYRSVS